MDVYINLKENEDLKHLKKYFENKDLVSMNEIVEALEYEVGKNYKGEELKEKIFDELDKELEKEVSQIEK